MAITLFPTQNMQAEVILPASKSISNRALIIHALANGSIIKKEQFGTILKNISDCDDTSVMVRALTEMPDTIDIMAAGTAMRFLTAYLSVTPGTHIITGTERMRHRPIGILVDALRRIGAQVEYVGEEGFPPLRITGGKQCEQSVHKRLADDRPCLGRGNQSDADRRYRKSSIHRDDAEYNA